MQKSKTGKISIFNSLDVKLEFLTSWVKLTHFSVNLSRVKLKIWATQLKLNWKCEQLNSILIQVQNVNSKLNLMISLILSFTSNTVYTSTVEVVLNVVFMTIASSFAHFTIFFFLIFFVKFILKHWVIIQSAFETHMHYSNALSCKLFLTWLFVIIFHILFFIFICFALMTFW